MRKNKYLFLLLSVAATATGCFGNTETTDSGDIVFWSSFGSKYTTKLNSIVEQIQSDSSLNLGFQITHTSKGSYTNIRTAVLDAIANHVYPGVAVGYPDHFAQYQGRDILVPLENYFTEAELAQYDQDYLPENYLVEKGGKKHLYGVPFNKSTELLGYNGVFVDYCVEKEGDASLRTLPTTWDEWALAKDEPSTKAGKYLKNFNELLAGKKVVYATQAENGSASGFVDVTDNEEAETAAIAAGKVKVFDYKNLKEDTQTMLFTWDSPDNAFITMLRQFGSQYTALPESQYALTPTRRVGQVLCVNNDNLSKTLSMLKYMNKLNKDGIFGTPSDLGGNYSSEAFSKGYVMFMICSSGGLSYNTENWERRFTLAPIPYKTADKKYVISQGANLCITKNGNTENAVKLVKALTTGKYQTKWAMDTGYFPAVKNPEPEYQDFLDDTSYADSIAVTYREGAHVNENYYKKASEGWKRFVDDAFIGSAVIREKGAAEVFNLVFKNVNAANLNNDDAYKLQLKNIFGKEILKNNTNIAIDGKENIGL